MSRLHDMGGRFGDGPVVPETDDTVFHEDWHARALALTLGAGFLGQWNIDVSRHARECLSPQDYTAFSYYEKWMAGLADLMVAKGVVTKDELAGGTVSASDLASRKATAENVAGILASGGPADRPSDIQAVFKPGDSVRSIRPFGNRLVDGGHTRLPSYAAGSVGRVVRLHGSHVFPDASAHGLGDQAEPLYAVAFAASELWAQPEHPNDEVVLDLWQSYLEPSA